MVKLPDRTTDVGAESRLLLAECRGPSAAGYSLASAKECMQHMDRVLTNRLKDPGKFGARGATTYTQIIKAKGQFAGFENYPNYDGKIVTRLQAMLDIANSGKDTRSADFTDFITAASDIATSKSIDDPSPGKLAFWRTAGHSGPGGSAVIYKSMFGVDFYYVP